MSQRKLQGEMERTFKKICEGVDEFNYIYDKLMDSENTAPKDKLETDLKKEIKRLQRLREQIKNWMSSDDIKDKKRLIEHRKMVEREMERFKDVEKVMKTKAFSNEALMSSDTLTLDPHEKEKAECSEYLESSIDTLKVQMEGLEAELERLSSMQKKKRNDKDMDAVEERLSKHKWHVAKLENVMRQLINDKLTVDQVNRIRDDIDYFVESNDDPNFIEDDDFYEVLELSSNEEDQESTPSTPAPIPAVVSTTPGTPKEKPEVTAEQPKEPKESVRVPKAAPKVLPKDLPKEPKRERTPSRVVSEPQPTLASQLHNSGLRPATPVETPKLKYATVASAALHQPKSRSSTPTPIKPVSLAPAVKQQQQQQQPFLTGNDLGNLPSGFDKYVGALEAVRRRLGKQEPSFDQIFPQLESSLLNCPDSYDADVPRNYHPTNQFVTQPCFPQEPSVEITGSTKLLKKLTLDTLIYTFYYHNEKYRSAYTNVHHLQKSTDDDYLQYIAAQELYNRGWLYDRKQQVWHHEKDGGQEVFDFKDTWGLQQVQGTTTFDDEVF